MLKLGVIGSGKGSNCQAILDAIAAGTLKMEVACILSDYKDAGILDRGREHNIPSFYQSAAPYKTKLEGDAEAAYIEILNTHNVDIVVLAGFMRIVKPGLLAAFPRKIINIHPSLLPKFPGLAAWEQALTSGDTHTGCTVHYVDKGVDTGPTILQKKVAIEPKDTAATLHARIQVAEHEAYPEALKLVAKSSFPPSST